MTIIMTIIMIIIMITIIIIIAIIIVILKFNINLILVNQDLAFLKFLDKINCQSYLKFCYRNSLHI